MNDELPLILLGRVVKPKDPEPDGARFGRVQVKIQGYGSEVTTPWLRVLQTTASEAHGHFFLPEVGDEVVILRGHGNHAEGMIVLGCLYGGKKRIPATPPEDSDNNIKQIVTRSKHELTFDDTKDATKVTLKTGTTNHEFTLDDTKDKGKVTLKTGDGKLMIEMDVAKGALTIKNTGDGGVTIESTKALTLKGDTVDITAKSGLTADGGSEAAIKGGAVKLG